MTSVEALNIMKMIEATLLTETAMHVPLRVHFKLDLLLLDEPNSSLIVLRSVLSFSR